MFKHVNSGMHIELELPVELESVAIQWSKKVVNHFQRYKQAFK